MEEAVEEEEEEEEEIHKSCQIGGAEDCPRSLDPERASTKASTSGPDDRAATHWGGFFRLLKKGPHMKFHTFPKLTRRKSKRIREDMVPPLTSLDAELCYFKSSWKNFTLSELQIATNNFSHGLSSTRSKTGFDGLFCFFFFVLAKD